MNQGIFEGLRMIIYVNLFIDIWHTICQYFVEFCKELFSTDIQLYSSREPFHPTSVVFFLRCLRKQCHQDTGKGPRNVGASRTEIQGLISLPGQLVPPPVPRGDSLMGVRPQQLVGWSSQGPGCMYIMYHMYPRAGSKQQETSKSGLGHSCWTIRNWKKTTGMFFFWEVLRWTSYI